MSHCLYYQAVVNPQQAWFLVGVLRSFEHLAFDRTCDKATSTFEFLVPISNERHFLEIMHYFQGAGVISSFAQYDNRLLMGDAQV